MIHEEIPLIILGIILAVMLYLASWQEKIDNEKRREFEERRRSNQERVSLGETGP